MRRGYRIAIDKLAMVAFLACVVAPFFISGLELSSGNLACGLASLAIGIAIVGVITWRAKFA